MRVSAHFYSKVSNKNFWWISKTFLKSILNLKYPWYEFQFYFYVLIAFISFQLINWSIRSQWQAHHKQASHWVNSLCLYCYDIFQVSHNDHSTKLNSFIQFAGCSYEVILNICHVFSTWTHIPILIECPNWLFANINVLWIFFRLGNFDLYSFRSYLLYSFIWIMWGKGPRHRTYALKIRLFCLLFTRLATWSLSRVFAVVLNNSSTYILKHIFYNFFYNLLLVLCLIFKIWNLYFIHRIL